MDRLNEINDAFTHTAGDRVLIAVADRIVAAVGDRGPVARTADNELSVLLQDPMARSTLLDFIAELQAAGSGPVPMGAQDIPVTVSIGVAAGSGSSPLELLRDASTAMHRAKESGGNRWEFANPHLAEEARQRLLIQTGLRDALASGQIQAWYQPVVTLPDGRLQGYEALARWIRDDGTVVPPDDFIPVAEQTNLIVDLDGSILRQALEAMAWIPANLHVAVNLSAATLALNAGCDLVLLCNQSLDGGQAVDRLLDGLTEGLERGIWTPQPNSEARRLALLPRSAPLPWDELMHEPAYLQALERLGELAG